ncbi:UbiA prenyltransferase [Dentipellis sp. KUC8613]|nr:UbiA prenyltransferase [Dentipellis sp. KUC8613]
MAMWRAYWELARLHKFPLGNILVFWPCAWTLMLGASKSGLTTRELALWTALLALGSTLLHSAACVLNDICDIDFDRQVERTKNRPLVTGKISMFSAVVWLAVLTGSYLWMLTLMNETAALHGILAVAPFHALYPLMKRWTWWPQAWLGLAMNWGMWVTWYALNDDAKESGMRPFFAGLVCWTILYDTIYACQDWKDDAKAGVKSTALLFGEYVRPILFCFGLAFVASLTYVGFCNEKGLPFYLVSCGGALAHIVWQLTTWDPHNPKECGAKFKSNGDMGYIIWAGLALDYWLDSAAAV